MPCPEPFLHLVFTRILKSMCRDYYYYKQELTFLWGPDKPPLSEDLI